MSVTAKCKVIILWQDEVRAAMKAWKVAVDAQAIALVNAAFYCANVNDEAAIVLAEKPAPVLEKQRKRGAA